MTDKTYQISQEQRTNVMKLLASDHNRHTENNPYPNCAHCVRNQWFIAKGRAK